MTRRVSRGSETAQAPTSEEKAIDGTISLDIRSSSGGLGRTMFSASECRAQAQKCMDLAEVARAPGRRLLHEIAHNWLKLVRHIEISDVATIVEMSSPALSPTDESSGLNSKIRLS